MTEVPEDQVRGLENDAEKMEESLDQLQDHIETAHDRADEQRERARPEGVAGDWEDEGAGAHQGADATEAVGDAGDAPVHEAEQVDPGGGDGDGGSADDDEGSRGGAVSLEGAEVHEAEQVDPDGSGDDDS